MVQSASTNTPSPKPPETPAQKIIKVVVALLAVAAAVWFLYPQFFPQKWAFEIPDRELETNVREITAEQLLKLPFTNEQGEPVSLQDRVGKNHQVIVFTRGSLASVSYWNKGKTRERLVNVCPYCTSQVSGIAATVDEFRKAGAEVVVIFPISQRSEAKDLEPLRTSATSNQVQVFPLWLDLDLKAVDALQIRQHLARPSSFILDKAGRLRFAYVGSNADRPSGGELLRHVKELATDFPLEPVEQAELSTETKPLPADRPAAEK
ncbi:peroxiredoxin family protein [Anatilimnocola sp. NA78]|uniref:peroxiredoxin family protein n=1 Tax=Anatilimnocola sp. NA78 TaxID=3415683 RepID=UPI003CE479D5